MYTLCIDGGSTKAMFSYKILQYMRRDFSDLHFDMIVGVSAGAVIGMLFALGIEYDDDVIHEYMRKIFSSRRGSVLFSSMFAGGAKRAVLESMFKERTLGDIERTKVVIPVEGINGDPLFVESWNEKYKNMSIVDVLDATTSIPLMFPPVGLNSDQYFDGGTVTRTPISLAYLYSKLVSGGDDIRIVSIGTTNMPSPVVMRSEGSDYGIVHMLASGLMLKLALRGGDVFNDLTMSVLGEHGIFSIRGGIDMKLDNVDVVMMRDIVTQANSEWEEKKLKLLQWLNK